MNVNVFDVILIALPVAFLVLGFIHSAWREFLSLLGIAFGAAVGAQFGHRVSELIVRVVPDADLSAVIAFLVILAGGWALGSLFGSMAERLQSGSRAEGSRLLPALYGLVKGGVLDVALVWLVDRHIAAFHTPLRNATLPGYANEVLSFLARHNPL